MRELASKSDRPAAWSAEKKKNFSVPSSIYRPIPRVESELGVALANESTLSRIAHANINRGVGDNTIGGNLR